jgi:phage tail-like protein
MATGGLRGTAAHTLAGASRSRAARRLGGGARRASGLGARACRPVRRRAARAAPRPVDHLAVCTDIASEAEHPEFGALLVVAQLPGDNFLRLRLLGNQPTLLPPLLAPHYDGRGIALAPDCRIAYWTAQGLRHAAPARAQYRQRGQVFAFALDSEHDQTPWGRLVVEACIPVGTGIRFRAFTRDDLEFADPIDGKGLGGETPVLSQHTWDSFARATQALFRDPSQRPLTPAPAEGFALYDAPLIASPGRYLWLVFEFTGTRSKSPRLRSARVEYPGHDLLKKLPRTLWREAAARDFLYRYLMPPAALLDEWQAVAGDRHRLLDSRIAPESALSWLASFLGLVLDACWAPAVQRQMIAEAATLFRTRGTLSSLQRMVEILTGAEVVIIEHFRLRGGGVVGNPHVNASQAVLGVGYRVGGAIGDPRRQALASDKPAAGDDFENTSTISRIASRSASLPRSTHHNSAAFAACSSCTSRRTPISPCALPTAASAPVSARTSASRR